VEALRSLKHIASRDNPRYRHVRRLVASGKARRTSGEIVLDGIHLIEAYALAYGMHPMLLIVRASQLDDAGIKPWVSMPHAESVVMSDALFDELSPVTTPTGLMAVVPIPQWRGVALQGFAVLVDGVQDPGNLGAILRSAAAAGGSRAFLSSQCADAWSPKCLRGGMGAHFALEVCERQELPAVATALPGKLVVADAAASLSLFAADLRGPVSFVIGGEGHGVSDVLCSLAHLRVRIPMSSGIESLNAAAAASVVFYEWRRQQERVGAE
jgi:RNA methyltransferase, TrmH family